MKFADTEIMSGFHTLKATSSKRSSMKTRKSIKELYDENRLLYAKRKTVNPRQHDPEKLREFLVMFYEKKRRQLKMRYYMLVLSGLLTVGIVIGIVNGINSLL